MVMFRLNERDYCSYLFLSKCFEPMIDFKYLVNELGAGNAGDEYISMAFQQMDSNGNGQLDLSEAMAGFGKIKEFVDSHRGDEVE